MLPLLAAFAALLAGILPGGPGVAFAEAPFGTTGRRLDVQVNPPRGGEPAGQWYVVVWSLNRPDVDVVSRFDDLTPRTSRGAGLSLAVDDKRVRGIMDTRDLPAPRGKLATVVLRNNIMPGDRAWEGSRDGIRFDVPLRILESEQQGNAVSYIAATFILSSARSKRSFWLQVQFFDTRGRRSARELAAPPHKAFDRLLCSPTRSTNLPILSATAGSPSRFVSFLPGSPDLVSQAGPTGTFRFVISKENLRAMLSTLGNSNDWCTNGTDFAPDDLDLIELRQASVMVETHFGTIPAGTRSDSIFSRLHFEAQVPTVIHRRSP
ncbi:MAG: hypothetical protein CTY25_03600 [Methylobacterium sp.]|nr:MAG: hypothetical protein CTY25_03600 [Methylobacterium sp.]